MSLFVRYQPISLGGGGGGGGSTLSMGTFDGQAAAAEGATITLSQLFMQSADATHPGLVNISTQTWAGVKTFSSAPIMSALTASQLVVTNGSKALASQAIGSLTAAGTDGIAVTGGSSSVIGAGTSIAQHVATASFNGYLSSTDWSTFNNKQAALTLTNLTDAGTDGIVITNGTGAVIGASPVTLAQHVADSTHNGYLSSTDWVAFNAKQATISIGAFDTTPNTAGLSLSGAAISLSAADGTRPGGLSAAAQTIGGVKTFSSAPVMSALTASQVVVTDGSKNLASLAYASANTASALVQRDGSGNFSAGTITAALTGTASGNLQATANQYGVLVSGSGNTATVIAPDASTTKVFTSGGSSANPSWQTPTAAPTSSKDSWNLGLSATVAANALTIALKQADGTTDPSTGAAAVTVSFRNATLTTGSYAQVTATAATSVVVSSGSTLGTTSGGVQYLYVYAINNAGTLELAVVGMATFDEGSVWTTTAEGGAGGADSAATLYSTTARASKAIRLIGRIRITEATAGTWATSPSEVSVYPFPMVTAPTQQRFTSGTAQTYTTPTSPRIPLYLKVRMVGGGGGGGGGGTTTTGGIGGAGGNSTFGTSLLVANGGGGGEDGAAGTGGAGGTASVTAPAFGTAFSGAYGVATGISGSWGSPGANSVFGGAGVVQAVGSGASGGAGVANTGAGGAGGASAGGSMGCGGGSGGYVEAIITSPATTYTYSVGTAGSAGSAGTSGGGGGAGAVGYIEVTEYYQ